MFKVLATMVTVVAVIGAAAAVAASAPAENRPLVIAAVAGAAAVTLLAGAGLLQRFYWVLPIRDLEKITSQMTHGDWSQRAEPVGADPVRELANHLNLLAAQIQKQLTDLQQQRGGLRALMDTMPDAILAADAQGRIVLLNAPAAQLLSVTASDVLNQKLIRVVNDEQIVELYEALTDPRTTDIPDTVQREIRLVRNTQRSTYQAIARRMASGSSLLVLRDITALASAVQMKTDFVANASHELRTPIAAIKAAFETLRDVRQDDPIQTDRCIDVIDGQLRRLEEMLRDLMDLSRVESPDNKPQVATIKTSDLLAPLKSTMGTLARQKNVELRVGDDDPAAPAEFFTDTRLFHLVVKNLVENSIKFTAAGGKVSVTLRETAPPSEGMGGIVTVTIADTGIGIAREHRDRVFERFYQVDSARSGTTGRGSGLGLAIVKHAMLALGGNVRLDSTLGVGTTVTCIFPQPAATPPSEESQPQSAVA
jgi:two-component system, OmpR family, phosphate regulon sensor histidine kinase PhoR